jgi:5'-nucleotidase
MMGSGPPPVVWTVWDELPDLPVHAIDAPPAMAVFATCLGAFGDLPDLICSGINPGANTGHLVLHSGTVGATLTGAGYNIPGVAVSIDWSIEGKYHWDVAARLCAAAVEWVAKPDGDTRVLNLNVPNVPLHEIKGVREAELAPAGEVWVASADVSQGDLKIEITGRADPAPGTDVALVHDGYASVTPLMSIVRGPARGAADAITEALD